MKLLLATLLCIASISASATINPEWSFHFDELNTNGQKQAHWTLKSKHPDKDITVIMRFVVLLKEGNPNEWQIEYVFGPKAHNPKEMLWLKVNTNYRSDISDRRGISGRSVISKGLTPEEIDRFRRQWEKGEDLGEYPRELTINYKTPDTHFPNKRPWEQGVRATFSLNNWGKAYRQLVDDVVAKGGMGLLLTVDVLKHWPISELPANTIKPPDDELEQYAKFLYLDMDELKQMSLAELKFELEVEDYFQQSKKAQKAKPKPKTMSPQTAKILREFRWPAEHCQRPTVPGLHASSAKLNRFRRAKSSWTECLIDAVGNDSDALDSLILNLGGSLKPRKLSTDCNCHQQITQLVDEARQRADNYVARTDRLNDAIESWNSRQRSQRQQQEFWDGIYNSLDDMDRQMQQLEQQRQQRWSQPMYVSPGYE